MNHVEQDRGPPIGDDDLPTYDDLAAQEGPNSRFGRWRGWIEKRAAERYMSITPEERARRRERGWGNEEMDALDPEPPTPTSVAGLTIKTKSLRLSTFSTLSEPPPDSPPLPPLPAVSTVLRPAHLKMNHFGSRFLPHTTCAIRCLLPVEGERLLLIGHDEGLSVLDMFPQDWNESGGIDLKGPEEAKVYTIWQGERVHQMSILELDSSSGVVLMLVGPESESPVGKDAEGQRTVRMYNLASLISLAKWAVAHRGANPLNLGTFSAQQTTPKRHRPSASLARGLKSLIPPTANQSEPGPPSSYQNLLSPTPSVSGSGRQSPRPPAKRDNSEEWELVVDELPLRWARDFVPLAAAGSRLLNLSILSFALWKKDEGSYGQYLAVATKNSILLYETPPNERAFRFVKEFYTPLQAKSISFFLQSVHDIARSPTDVRGHRRTGSNTTTIHTGRSSSAVASPGRTTNYGTQLSIFVVFEKKAGWIRLADSAVGEMGLLDDPQLAAPSGYVQHARSVSGTGTQRRRHVSGVDPQSASGWLPPVRAELPDRSVYLLTRGATTHIVPCPMPTQAVTVIPLGVLSWRDPPTHVAPRVGPAYIQLTALGEGSVEVQELSLEALGSRVLGNGKGKGKGKGRAVDVDLGLAPVRAAEDAGGETGFLCTGGHWDDPRGGMFPGQLQRTYSTASDASGQSFASMDTDEMVDKLRREQGIYGWCRKGLQDWRVFWLGGSFADEPGQDASETILGH